MAVFVSYSPALLAFSVRMFEPGEERDRCPGSVPVPTRCVNVKRRTARVMMSGEEVEVGE